jgi:hypothetical protein
VAEKVAAAYDINPDEVLRKGRQKPRYDAPGLLCCRAARELKIPLIDLARKLGMTVSGIGYAVQRGETVALRNNYQLLE